MSAQRPLSTKLAAQDQQVGQKTGLSRASVLGWLVCCTALATFATHVPKIGISSLLGSSSAYNGSNATVLGSNATEAPRGAASPVAGETRRSSSSGEVSGLLAVSAGHVVGLSNHEKLEQLVKTLRDDSIELMNEDKKQVVTERKLLDSEDDLVKKGRATLREERELLKKEERDAKDAEKLIRKGKLKKAAKLVRSDRHKLENGIAEHIDRMRKLIDMEHARDAEVADAAATWTPIEAAGVAPEMKAKHAKEEKRHARLIGEVSRLEDQWHSLEQRRNASWERLTAQERTLAASGAL